MQKVFAMLITIVLVMFSPVSVSENRSAQDSLSTSADISHSVSKDAAVSAGALENNTYTRHGPCSLIEFEELAMSRFIKNYPNIDKDDSIKFGRGLYFTPPVFPYIDSFFGLITPNMDDFSVQELSMQIATTEIHSDELLKRINICSAALSALEFDGMSDDLMAIGYKYGMHEYFDAFDAAFMIFGNEIMPEMQKVLNSRPEKGDRYLVYSGCYNYYVSFYSDNEVQRIYLDAELNK